MRRSSLRHIALTTLGVFIVVGQPLSASALSLGGSVRPSEVAANTPGSTVVVTPGADASWINSIPNGGSLTSGISTYALAPVGGPAGAGAFRHRLATSTDSAAFSSSAFAGLRLAAITELGYSTFAQSGPNVTTLRLQLDLNGDGFYQNNTIDDELVFEPRYQSGTYQGESFPSQCAAVPGCIAQGAWQTWNAREGGWHSRRANTNGPPLKTLASWSAIYPGAAIAQGTAVIFKSGSAWAGTNVYFDGLRVNGVTYDFEPQRIEITPDAEPGFLRQTQTGATEILEPRTAANSFQQYSAAVRPHVGRGSLHHRLNDSNDRLIMTAGHLSGLPLAQITSLSYATYQRRLTRSAAPFLSIPLDLNGDGVFQGYPVDDTLNFLPSLQKAGHPSNTSGVTPQCGDPCLPADTWQVWDALNGGWYSRKAQVGGDDLQQTKRLDQWLATSGYENAKVAVGGVKLQSGSGFGYLDTFIDAINMNGVTYDFETQIVTVAPQSPAGWTTLPLAGSRSGDNDRRQDFENAVNAVFGSGGLRQRAPASHDSEDLVAATHLLAGQPLQNITELSYTVKVDQNTSDRAPILKVQVDYDGDNYYTTQAVDRLVIFEPYYQAPQYWSPQSSYPHGVPSPCTTPCVKRGQWQTWDVLAGGVYFGGQDDGTVHPWDEHLAALRQPIVDPTGSVQNITRGKVAFGDRPISIETDNVFSGMDSTIDSVTINGVTFDFEAAIPEPQLDGARTQDEPYRLIVNDTTVPNGVSPHLAIYGACTSDAVHFSIEATNPGGRADKGNLFFDMNGNDVYDGRAVDRQFLLDNETVREGDGSLPAPGAQMKHSPGLRTMEVRIPRSLVDDAWFGYSIDGGGTGPNTSWNDNSDADQKGFIPSPCIPIPEEVFGATPIDCALYDTDIRIIQYVLDRSASTRLKLSGTCDITGAVAHGGTTTSIAAAALVAARDGVTIESLDMRDKAVLQGSGIQAGIYVAPGARDVTVRGLAFTNLSRPIVAQNSIRTTIGAATALEPLSPLGNRMLGVGTMREGVLAIASGVGDTTTVKYGSGGLFSRSFATPTNGDTVGVAGPAGQDLVDVQVVGNYIAYRPIGPFTAEADVTGIVVRQRGGGRDAFGVDVSQNAVGLSGTEFPSFNLAGIRIHADSNDPAFAHIQDVRVFKNTLGRIEELNLSSVDDNLPDAGDLHSTGRTGITIGRASDFVVQGNSIRTILSKVPGIDMPGGGIVVFDSFDGHIETNSIITIAGPDTAKADLGAIGIVDNLMALFNPAPVGPGKPTRNIEVVANYTGWSGNNPSDVGAQRGLVISGATGIRATLNQFKTISDRAIRIGEPIAGPGTAFGWPATLPGQSVNDSTLCSNWLNIHRGNPGSENAADTPPSQIVFNGSGLGSSGNQFPKGSFHRGNSNC